MRIIAILSTVFLMNACSSSDGSISILDWFIDEDEEISLYGGDVEFVIEKFANALADGKCDYALKLSTGNAYETVQGTIDAGCEPYDTEIVGVNCDVSSNTAKCICEEVRGELGEMTFNYDMKRIDGHWKVSNYEKDMSID
ncbi:hypothetical protein K6119_03395 [Paracrocinitomix mangrovi]|uniref:hypothetical protein n=1 Tax=Paracrocinitomix mangrovi TaxID=2862509 RepID=UPI001C8DAFB6|nr:hypothetical protein [Paracrocinitomix mangrovi]UKN02560.1 hypothetical protein K6119_03395 [Paracrocinitomix mangrovi]